MTTKFNTFAKIANELTLLSPVMTGRDKINTKEIINKYPKGITINEVDIIQMVDDKTGEIGDVAVCSFKEDPTKFFFGGLIITKIVKGWAGSYAISEGGSFDKLNADLHAEGGVKMILDEKRTRHGNSITSVKIVEE